MTIAKVRVIIGGGCATSALLLAGTAPAQSPGFTDTVNWTHAYARIYDSGLTSYRDLKIGAGSVCTGTVSGGSRTYSSCTFQDTGITVAGYDAIVHFTLVSGTGTISGGGSTRTDTSAMYLKVTLSNAGQGFSCTSTTFHVNPTGTLTWNVDLSRWVGTEYIDLYNTTSFPPSGTCDSTHASAFSSALAIVGAFHKPTVMLCW